MAPETGRLDALRLAISSRLYRLAHAIEPPERGEPCVDCGFPIPAGYTEDECPTCAAAWEQQQLERSVYDQGHHDGFFEAAERYAGEPF